MDEQKGTMGVLVFTMQRTSPEFRVSTAMGSVCPACLGQTAPRADKRLPSEERTQSPLGQLLRSAQCSSVSPSFSRSAATSRPRPTRRLTSLRRHTWQRRLVHALERMSCSPLSRFHERPWSTRAQAPFPTHVPCPSLFLKVVAGTMMYLKIHTGKDFVHAKVFRSLPPVSHELKGVRK